MHPWVKLAECTIEFCVCIFRVQNQSLREQWHSSFVVLVKYLLFCLNEQLLALHLPFRHSMVVIVEHGGRWLILLVAASIVWEILLSRCHWGLVHHHHHLLLLLLSFIQSVLALTIFHLLVRWRLMVVGCKFYSTTRWSGLLLQLVVVVVLVAETRGTDKHELFRTRIERLHVVEGLGVTLLVEYLSLRGHRLTRCLLNIVIIGI